MLTKINHIGIAVKSLDETLPFYRDQLSAWPLPVSKRLPNRR